VKPLGKEINPRNQERNYGRGKGAILICLSRLKGGQNQIGNQKKAWIVPEQQKRGGSQPGRVKNRIPVWENNQKSRSGGKGQASTQRQSSPEPPMWVAVFRKLRKLIDLPKEKKGKGKDQKEGRGKKTISQFLRGMKKKDKEASYERGALKASALLSLGTWRIPI